MPPRGVSPLSPQRWGRAMWWVLHVLAALVLDDAMEAVDGGACDAAAMCREFAKLLAALPVLLPCSTCRDNLAEHMRGALQLPAMRGGAVRQARALQRWVHDVHNAVNASTGRAAVPAHVGMDAVVAAHLARGERGVAVRLLAASLAAVDSCVFESVRERLAEPAQRHEVERAWVLYRRVIAALYRGLRCG
jgi:hypothetical protein